MSPPGEGGDGGDGGGSVAKKERKEGRGGKGKKGTKRGVSTVLKNLFWGVEAVPTSKQPVSNQ